MEQRVGLDVSAHFGGVVQLELSDHVDDLMHFVGIFVKVHQAALDLQQIMALLEYAGGEKRSDELLVSVHLLGHGDEGLPFLRVVDHAGDLYVIAPMLYILDDYLFRGVYGEGTGSADRIGFGHAPGVHHVVLAELGVGVAVAEGRAHDYGKGLVLIYKPVRMTAADRFQKVLLFAEHLFSPFRKSALSAARTEVFRKTAYRLCRAAMRVRKDGDKRRRIIIIKAS